MNRSSRRRKFVIGIDEREDRPRPRGEGRATTIARREPRSATLNSATSAGARGHRGDRPGRDRDHRDSERVAAAPPQREQRDDRRSGGRGTPSSPVLVLAVGEHDQADRQRGSEHHRVDDPVARRALPAPGSCRRPPGSISVRVGHRGAYARGRRRTPTEVDPGIDRRPIRGAARPMLAAMIEATGLTKRLGGRTVVSDVSSAASPAP